MPTLEATLPDTPTVDASLLPTPAVDATVEVGRVQAAGFGRLFGEQFGE